MEATKQTVVEEYQDRCVELEQRLADASEAINLIHDVTGTGGNGGETFTSIASRAVRKYESLRAENARLRLVLARIDNTQPMISDAMSDWRETAIYCSRIARAALAGSR